MKRKIIGVTVGTTISPSKMASKVEEKINPVKTVNGKAPDENGNVEVDVKIAEANGYKIVTSLNTIDYKLTISLVDGSDKVVSSSLVDFPLESVVVGGDEKDGIVTLTLQNGEKITFDIGDLVDGLVSQAKHNEDIAAMEGRFKTLEDAVADLNYKAIEISGFSASPSTAEMGSTVSSVALSWAVNKTPTELTLDGAAVDVAATSKTVTGTFTAYKEWALKATDERGATSSKTASLSFLNGVYYGVSTEPAAYDSAFILGLTKNLRSSKLTSFSVKAGSGQYIYYCLPKRMGTCSFKVGGFDGGFSLVDTISFTNASGYAEDYYVYRSDNAGLGQTAVTVS